MIGKIRHPEYTDLCVVIGPNVNWVKNDYEDLQRQRPEVLLGYRVMLTTAFMVVRDLRGRRPRPVKVIILDSEYSRWELHHLQDMEGFLEFHSWSRVERWHVHRVRGIYRVA